MSSSVTCSERWREGRGRGGGRKGKGWGKEGEEGVKEKEKERRGSFESFAELKTRGGEHWGIRR